MTAETIEAGALKRRTVATHTSGRGVTDVFQIVARDDGSDREALHVRIPATVCPSPGRAFNALDMEDWIIGSFFVNYLRLWQNPPCVTELMKVSGRSYERITAALERMAVKGWIGRAKIRNEYAPGQFGYRWRIWLPTSSPLVQLRDGRKGDGFRWIAVPARVARYASPLAVAVFLICHEQKRLDGAITTTPSDLGALLDCDRTTAWRILKFIGATAVVEGRAGRTIYDLPLVYDTKVVESVYMGEHLIAIHGDRDRQAGRWKLLIATLTAGGVTRDELIVQLDQLASRGVQLRVDLLMRVFEERYRRILTKSPKYRARLALRFGWRMRAGLRRLTSRDDRNVFQAHTTAQVDERDELRVAIRDALSHQCSTCDDTHLVVVADEAGREFGTACPVCT